MGYTLSNSALKDIAPVLVERHLTYSDEELYGTEHYEYFFDDDQHYNNENFTDDDVEAIDGGKVNVYAMIQTPIVQEEAKKQLKKRIIGYIAHYGYDPHELALEAMHIKLGVK